MLLRRTLTAAALLALLLGASGCKFGKKKPPVPAPQATAPTLKPSLPPSDNPGPPPPVASEPARPMPTPGEATENAQVQKPAPKPKTHVARKTVPPPPPVEPPKATVDSAGKTPTQQGQLTATVTQGQALQQRVDTAQLISTTENALRSITRQLSTDEQAMIQHIRSFIKQSQTASNEGDIERAYNLALKARQLSDELVKK
jgi:hypothetical protein